MDAVLVLSREEETMLKLKQRGTFVMVAATLSMGGMMGTADASTQPFNASGVVVHDTYTSVHRFIAKQFQADLIVRQIELKGVEATKKSFMVAGEGGDGG
jgi:hypothetical protein